MIQRILRPQFPGPLRPRPIALVLIFLGFGAAISDCFSIISLLESTSWGQDVVRVGKGSYASTPPDAAGDAAREMASKLDLFILGEPNRPTPSNKWWTHLLHGRFTGALWAYPLKVEASEKGLQMTFPTRWNPTSGDVVSEHPLTLNGVDFKPTETRAKDWSDWLVSFRINESPGGNRFMDVTLGRGMPYAWVECAGVDPRLSLDDDARFFDVGGKPVSLPATTDALGIECGGRSWGVFAPPGTRFDQRPGEILITFNSPKTYLVICPLPKREDIALFYKYAFAVPRSTRMDYTYDRATAQVSTRWHVTTDALQGSNHQIIQGWLPHHYRAAKPAFALDGPEYLTPRGTMKSAVGNEFTIAYAFNGVVPYLPAPKPMGLPHDYDPARLQTLLSLEVAKKDFGSDTYWGGKELLYLACDMAYAAQIGDPTYQALHDDLVNVLSDWFTYTPGERRRFFARYPNWRALVGFNESYGSARFTDNHFHYGYFTQSAAILGQFDPQFLADYGGMARLVAKQYANWDRADQDFPLFRTFEPWDGHSWAGGSSSPGGNNQESSSEAVQSWGGLIMLGEALGDDDMTAAGVMGYCMETSATLEYWFNEHGDNWSPGYNHPTVGIIFGGGQAYATYFNGDPLWVYGIQCLPVSPMLEYLGRDPAFGKRIFEATCAAHAAKNGPMNIAREGNLGCVLLGAMQQFDPDRAAEEIDKLWLNKEPVATGDGAMGMVFQNTFAHRAIGHRVYDQHMDLATSAVYFDERTQVYSYVVFNPHPYPLVLHVFDASGASKGVIVAPASKLSVANKVDPEPAAPGLMAMYPVDGQKSVTRNLQQVVLVASAEFESSSLASVELTGPGAAKLVFDRCPRPGVALFKIQGRLNPDGKYQVVAGGAVKSAAGAVLWPKGSRLSFETEARQPLAIVDSSPANGDNRVPWDVKKVTVQFNSAIDPGSTQGIHLEGHGIEGLGAEASKLEGQVVFSVKGKLSPDEAYTLTIPATIKDEAGNALAKETRIVFNAAPTRCPPNVYSDAFAGLGVQHDQDMTVDLKNAESPASGKFAIKITAGSKEGTAYFFAGTSDHGAERIGVDLSEYDDLEFAIKGTADQVWVKIGHPVHDKAFGQAQLKGITGKYAIFTLPVPAAAKSIGTLFVISVPAGKTIYLDNMRFIKSARAQKDEMDDLLPGK